MDSSVRTLEKYLETIFSDTSWVLIDCGAHKGSFTRSLLKHGSPSSVHLIEADPLLAEKLKDEFLSTPQRSIQIYNIALTETEGPVRFNIYDDAATSSVLTKTTETRQVARQVEVPGKSLQSLFENETRPCLLKTDLQGLDFKVLKSSFEFLKSNVRVCITEFIQHDLYQKQGSTFALLALMEEAGFFLFQILDLHSSSSGRLAFGDFVFVRKDFAAKMIELDHTDKLIQNELFSPYVIELKQAAEDRLELIQRLHSECERLRTEKQTPRLTFGQKVKRLFFKEI